MKIAVLIKHVPGSYSSLPIQSDESWINEESITYVMNESDNYALEEALQLREKNDDGEVVVISLGPDRVQKVIREGLAKGADRGIHIQVDSAGAVDPLVTASSIANAIKEEKFDLIFSGLQSDDIGMGQTGIILGEILGMSTASLVMATELSENRIKVKRELEAGFFQWVTMTLPSSVTIQSGLNTPRYPSLKGIMGAKKKEINVLTPGASEPKQSMNKVYVLSLIHI